MGWVLHFLIWGKGFISSTLWGPNSFLGPFGFIIEGVFLSLLKRLFGYVGPELKLLAGEGEV